MNTGRTEQIAILTDSTCDLPKDLVERYGIKVVPLRVLYGDKEYRDGIDISPDEVYGRMPQEIPKTSLPSPSDVFEILEDIKKQGFTHILAMHLSSGLSGTYNMVRQISEQVKDIAIEVVDSKSLSLGLGMPVLMAAKAVAAKENFAAVTKVAMEAIKKSKLFFVVETLEYLKKNGRIGKVSGSIGDLLNIKPLISIDQDGVYYTVAKVRGRQKSLEKLFELAKERMSLGRCTVAVMHGGAPAEAKALFEKLKGHPNVNEAFTGQIGPSMGVHSGPGLVGVCVLSH